MTETRAPMNAGAIEAEIRAAWCERRVAKVDDREVADWAIALDRLLQAGELDAAQHEVRLHASYLRSKFARTLGMIFDRLPPADGQHPFHDDLTKDVQIV